MSEADSLFREEAIQFKQGKQQSEVLLNCHVNRQALLWLLCAAVLGIVLLVNRINYKEVQSARGYLITEEREAQLVAPQEGLVQAILVTPGEEVEKGEPIARISQQLYDRNGEAVTVYEKDVLCLELEALNQEKTLQQQEFIQQSVGLRNRILGLQETIRLAAEGLQMLKAQEQISATLLAGTESLLEQQAVSQVKASQQQIAHLDLLRERQLAERQLHQLQQEIRESTAALTALHLEAQQTVHGLDKEIRLISLQLEKVESSPYLSVLANRDGIVSSISIDTGSAVRRGQPLIYLHPRERKLLAEIYVPSSIMGVLAPGQEVMLRYDAFNVHSYGRYPATITTIERTPLDHREHLLPVTPTVEPLFRVLVKPGQHYVEGEDIFPLQAGLQLSADFVTSEMSLIAYIFKPLLNLRGRVS